MLGRGSYALLLFILVILVRGSLSGKKFSKMCKINGVTFTEDQVALVFQDFCAQFVCRRRLRKNRKGKTIRKLHLVLESIPLGDAKSNGCSCRNDAVFWDNFLQGDQERSYIPSLSKDPHSARRQRQKRAIVERDEIKKNNDINTENKFGNKIPQQGKEPIFSKDRKRSKNMNQIGKKKGNQLRDSNTKSSTPSKVNKKKCKFNGMRYPAGSVLATLQERCVRIICLKVNEIESALAAELTTDCECSDEGISNGKKSPGRECKYSVFNKKHSMCLRKSACTNIRVQGLTEVEKRKVLDLHNQYRAKVARGEELRGNPGPQPSASNMRQLTWNDELARVAQAWADTCPTGHDCSACRRIFQHDYQVGQNLYWYWGWEADEKWNEAVSGFYDEVADVPESLVNTYGPIQAENQIGHYTQVVWADTDAIGCGAVSYGTCEHDGQTYEECKVYVCNYGQAGNWLGLPIYEEGPAASDCPKQMSTEYSGLCL